jgi:undecaprenyl-diphosphatase
MTYIATPALNNLMSLFAESFFIILPLIAIYLYLKKDSNFFSFIFAIAFLYIIGDIIKAIIGEPRPCSLPNFSWINHVSCESGFSFPSNHATTLTGPYFFINKYKYLRILYIIWLAIILFGRIYLGEHYFTDVIAGIIISAIIAFIIYKFSDKINKPCIKIYNYIFKNIKIKFLKNNIWN